MLADVQEEYAEFRASLRSRSLDEQLVRQARDRGVKCNLLIECGRLDAEHRQRLEDYASAGVEVRQAASLPHETRRVDGQRGLIALLDPVVTKPTWTSVVFEHAAWARR